MQLSQTRSETLFICAGRKKFQLGQLLLRLRLVLMVLMVLLLHNLMLHLLLQSLLLLLLHLPQVLQPLQLLHLLEVLHLDQVVQLLQPLLLMLFAWLLLRQRTLSFLLCLGDCAQHATGRALALHWWAKPCSA